MSNSFTVNTYSPKDVAFTIGGYQVGGWNNISIQRRVNAFVTIPGIRGKHTRVPTEDSSATLVVSLSQSSPSNDVLSRIVELDIENGTARIELILKDNSGRSVFQTNEAYILGYPVTTFTGGIEERVWTLFCQNTQTYNVGGNTRPSTGLFDSLTSSVSSGINSLF